MFTASPFYAGRRFADRFGIDFDQLFTTVFGSYHEDGDHPWHQVERGEVALSAAFGEINRRLADRNYEFEMKDFFAGMRDDIDRSFVQHKVRELKGRGLKMGVITNNVKEFEAQWKSLMPVDELFDDIVDSSAVGVGKPNPEIYRLALARLNISKPSAAVFLDDFEPNVVAARNIGIHGIHVQEDARPALAELDQMLTSR